MDGYSLPLVRLDAKSTRVRIRGIPTVTNHDARARPYRAIAAYSQLQLANKPSFLLLHTEITGVRMTSRMSAILASKHGNSCMKSQILRGVK